MAVDCHTASDADAAFTCQIITRTQEYRSCVIVLEHDGRSYQTMFIIDFDAASCFYEAFIAALPGKFRNSIAHVQCIARRPV